jgi:subtilisin family serine protease
VSFNYLLFLANKGSDHLKNRLIIIIPILTIIMLFTSCVSGTKPSISQNNTELKIVREPAPDVMDKSKMTLIGKYNLKSNDAYQIDFRSRDLSETDLSGKMDSIIYSSFDSQTKWPKSLPDNFDPKAVMEMGKNPGLNIRKLHEEGITGKGVGIAIIDQTLLVGHEEYKDRLKCYEEIHNISENAMMHGPAVASIAVGKNVGVAPGADLYYIASIFGTYEDQKFNRDFTWMAKSIDRIVEINNGLPEDKKIRVISISSGCTRADIGYEEVEAAIKRANKNNIFVVHASLNSYGNIRFYGLGRDILKDPDIVNSYGLSVFDKSFSMSLQSDNGIFDKLRRFLKRKSNQTIYVPMDSRTYASPIGNEDYTFSSVGGVSWSIPYIAGLYALCFQVNPNITPKEFWKEAGKTGDTINITYNDKQYRLGKIINPQKLIESIKKL